MLRLRNYVWLLSVLLVCLSLARAEVRQKATPQLSGLQSIKNALVLDLGAGVQMPLVRIKAGSFLMGSPESDKDASTDEKPQHKVTITKDFFLGKFDVTREEFERFVKERLIQDPGADIWRWGNGYNEKENTLEHGQLKYTWRNPGFQQTGRHPVVNVTWDDAQAFCHWLSKKTGKRCELPTEAQWEYACRAGTTTRYFTGEDPESLRGYANVRDQALKLKKIESLEKLALPYFDFSDGFAFTSPVTAMKPNPWGLHDMTGNVWQWCSDWYGKDYYANSDKEDPRGPNNGDARMMRGSSWGNIPARCRIAFRRWNPPSSCEFSVGFRVCVRLD